MPLVSVVGIFCMRIFVASWFFPPNTSSEGIVTYKLLRNSTHSYDVVTVTSHRWGYKNDFPINDDNIRVILLNTDSVEEWTRKAVELFRKEHVSTPYDAFMTRCMPREALEVGIKLKQEFPDVPWICSLADPVGNDPYARLQIKQSDDFSNREKKYALAELALPPDKWTRKWENHASNNISGQFRFKRLQNIALQTADLLIAPCFEQAAYMANGVERARVIHILPHSFDDALFEMAPEIHLLEPGKFHFSFFGYSYQQRSVQPFIEALKWIRMRCPDFLGQIQMHIFGNYEADLEKSVVQYGLDSVVLLHGSVDYLKSLAIMKQSDCLLHVDTYFPEFEGSGGSIFLAGKLADYVGAGKPIIGITGYGSPSWNVIDLLGGKTFLPEDIIGTAHAMIKFATGSFPLQQNEYFRNCYNAKHLAAGFDALLAERARCRWANDNIAGGEPSPNPAQKKDRNPLKELLRSLAKSRLFMNDFTMGFIKRQKEKNSFLFRIYKDAQEN